jgi:hypothetical protein
MGKKQNERTITRKSLRTLEEGLKLGSIDSVGPMLADLATMGRLDLEWAAEALSHHPDSDIAAVLRSQGFRRVADLWEEATKTAPKE